MSDEPNAASDTFDKEDSAAAGAAAAADQGGRKVAEHDTELTEDELSDLTFAFQACDLDDQGTIAPDELHAMLTVLGADVDPDACRRLIREAKSDFKAWVASHDEDAVLPEQFEHSKGKAHGVHAETKRSMRSVFAHVYEADGERITRFRQYADTWPMVAAQRDLELSEG